MTEPSSHDAPLRLLLAARSSRKPRKDANGEPAPDEGLGIQTQDERARAWAKDEGHVIVDVAADVRSGDVPPWDRPNLRPWVACGCGWCRDQDDKRNVPERRRVYDHGKITRYDGVLAFKMDRLSRGDDQDFALIEGWASHHGKKLVIVDGPQFPSRDDSDYWQWAAQKREAFKELQSIKERASRNRAKLTENKAVMGKPPFGLAAVGPKYHKVIVPTEQGRQLIPEAFDRIIAGESMGRVAAWLTAQTGRTFSRKAVRDLIYCTTYVGERRNARGVTVLTCEPVLATPDGKPDWARFRTAQKLLSEHPKRGPRSPGVLLSGGVLRCGAPGCTARMYRHVASNGKQRYTYYQCGEECGNRARLDWADMAVDAIVTATQDRPVTEVRLIPGNDFEAEKAAVREALSQLPLLGLGRRAEQDERERLWAEQDRLEELELRVRRDRGGHLRRGLGAVGHRGADGVPSQPAVQGLRDEADGAAGARGGRADVAGALRPPPRRHRRRGLIARRRAGRTGIAVTTLLEQARAEWLHECFWVDARGGPYWPRSECRSFAAGPAEDVQDRDPDDGDDVDDLVDDL